MNSSIEQLKLRLSNEVNNYLPTTHSESQNTWIFSEDSTQFSPKQNTQQNQIQDFTFQKENVSAKRSYMTKQQCLQVRIEVQNQVLKQEKDIEKLIKLGCSYRYAKKIFKNVTKYLNQGKKGKKNLIENKTIFILPYEVRKEIMKNIPYRFKNGEVKSTPVKDLNDLLKNFDIQDIVFTKKQAGYIVSNVDLIKQMIQQEEQNKIQLQILQQHQIQQQQQNMNVNNNMIEQTQINNNNNFNYDFIMEQQQSQQQQNEQNQQQQQQLNNINNYVYEENNNILNQINTNLNQLELQQQKLEDEKAQFAQFQQFLMEKNQFKTEEPEQQQQQQQQFQQIEFNPILQHVQSTYEQDQEQQLFQTNFQLDLNQDDENVKQEEEQLSNNNFFDIFMINSNNQ